MNFTRIGPNKVKSANGIIVWMQNPFQLHYIDGNRQLIIPSEMMTGASELLVSVSTIKNWGKQGDGEFIGYATKQEIIKNLESALRALDVQFEFD